MQRIGRAFFLALAVGALARASTAQQLTVPKTLVAGTTVTIGYSDPGRANTSITVDIDNGELPTPNVQHVQIDLDANGNGSATWQVPSWDLGLFNAPNVHEEMRVIGRGAGEPSWLEAAWSGLLSVLQ